MNSRGNKTKNAGLTGAAFGFGNVRKFICFP
jgi:hypothetical protein